MTIPEAGGAPSAAPTPLNTLPAAPTWEDDWQHESWPFPDFASDEERARAERVYHHGWLAGQRRPQAALDKAEVLLARITERVATWEREHYQHHGHYDLDARVDAMVRHFRDQSVQAFAQVTAFREDLISYLRGLVITVESALAAGTHREKDARLRGAISVVDAAIDKVREHRFRDERAWRWPDVFRSDYPVRRYLDKIRELEAKLAELTGDDASAGNGITGEESPF